MLSCIIEPKRHIFLIDVNIKEKKYTYDLASFLSKCLLFKVSNISVIYTLARRVYVVSF